MEREDGKQTIWVKLAALAVIGSMIAIGIATGASGCGGQTITVPTLTTPDVTVPTQIQTLTNEIPTVTLPNGYTLPAPR